jgi:hypothetical protein
VKRPSRTLYERQARIARYRADERHSRRRKHYVQIGNRYVVPGEIIRAPAEFNLIRGAGKEVCKFLRAVARAVLIDKVAVKLDFSRTVNFHVPGTILLFAELDRIIATSDLAKPVTILDPIQRRPREVLKQIGIHTLTGDSCDTVPEREDVVYWKAIKGGTQSGDTYGSLVEVLAAKVNNDHARKIEVSGLWRSVSEAVTNSVDHAYKSSRFDGFSGLQTTRWWMFSQIRDNVFTIAVCDLGCGYRATISETIPERFIASIAETFSGRNRDSLAIDTAMEYGRSGTHQGHRGKGSRDALSLLHRHGVGELVVLSNTGWMRYEYKKIDDSSDQVGELTRLAGDVGIDIGGTIVWWKLPLTERDHEHN